MLHVNGKTFKVFETVSVPNKAVLTITSPPFAFVAHSKGFRMCVRLPLVAICLLTSVSAYAQTTQPPPALSVLCPSTITAQAPDANGALVKFATPTTIGGAAPVTVSTVPTSGSRFGIGMATVTGTASDSAGQKATCTFTVTVTASSTLPAPPPQASSALLFQNGWERSTETRCNEESIMDGGAWDAAGGANLCPANEAGIDTNVFLDGRRSLRVTQYPGRQNGTDVRVVKMFGAQTDITFIGSTRYAEDFRFARGDQKNWIFMDAQQTLQNVYANFRGGRDPKHARVCIGVVPSDTVYCASNFQITVGQWYRWRIYIRAGSRGTVDVWMTPQDGQEVKLNLVHDGGRRVNWSSFNVGEIGGVKLDTTYNIGSSIVKPMDQWFDAVSVYRGLWPK